MSHDREELRSRVEAKKKRLEAELAETKADAHQAAGEKKEDIRRKLAELETTLKEGWENVSDQAVGKINEWLR